MRATGPGSISHRVIATSDIPDPNPANDSLIEENTAVALANLALTPATREAARLWGAQRPPSGGRRPPSAPHVEPIPG